MTVVNGIESIELMARKSETKQAILNNDKIEAKLNVIIVVSNPCEYERRWRLALEFMDRESRNDDINLFVVELAYGKQTFHVTEEGNPNHLQLRCEVPLWHKECMINLGVRYLLPKEWKAFAWIDADIEFLSPTWTVDTLKILNGSKDVVQLFSHCEDMNRNEETMNVFHSFGYQHDMGRKYCASGPNYFHPGFCWAMTRKAYERMGGLFERAILGAADHQMAHAFVGSNMLINKNTHVEYSKLIASFMSKCKNLRVGYVPGVIKHHFHGSKKNRKYTERWKILVKHSYNPVTFVTNDETGILVPTDACPQGLIDDIFAYFSERKEDD